MRRAGEEEEAEEAFKEMKAILQFDLPEEADEHRSALDGANWKFLVYDLDERIRRDVKGGMPVTYSPGQLRQILHEMMEERGLRFDQ